MHFVNSGGKLVLSVQSVQFAQKNWNEAETYTVHTKKEVRRQEGSSEKEVRSESSGNISYGFWVGIATFHL